MNVARAVRTLGGEADVVAALGGRTGALVAGLARDEGIDLTEVPVAGETRVCVSIIGEEATEVYERAPVVELDRLVEAAQAATGLVVSGSVVGDVGSLEGRLAAVDTSGAALAAFIEQRVPLVKVNRAEAAEALGRDDTAVALARAIHRRGVATVVVTDGEHGAAGVDSAGEWIAEADPAPGRFGVGSGDSFFAGLLIGLSREASLPDALLLASATGSANARRPGAGLFERAEVDAAMARISISAMR
jgi:fructose-1-phosphate kinase PfkB-like protein